MKRILFYALFLLVGGANFSFAQEANNTIKPKTVKTDADVLNFLRGLTIGGLVQTQWQLGEEKGMDGGPASGGAFSPNSNNRFMLRRGYLKVGYDGKNFSSLIQINATPEGVGLVNAFAQVHTTSKWAAFRMGNLYKPFGYFISYPSALRLAPEITRGEQTLFIDQTAVGGRLMLRDTREDKWTRFFSLDLACFTSTRLSNDTFASNEFIGRLEYVRPFGKFTLGAQVSMLGGYLVNVADGYFAYENGHQKLKTGVQGKNQSKAYYSIGANASLSSYIGQTKVIGEYVFGNQLGLANYNTTPSKNFSGSDATPLYDRNFSNYYIFLQHKIARSNFTVIARYDFMDPNTSVDTNEIKTINGFSDADVSYSTFGFGLHYSFWKNMSASAYYEIVSNEKASNLIGFDESKKDNLLTIRLQCAF